MVIFHSYVKLPEGMGSAPVASGHMSSKFVWPQWGQTHEGDDHGDDDGSWPRLVDLPSGYLT